MTQPASQHPLSLAPTFLPRWGGQADVCTRTDVDMDTQTDTQPRVEKGEDTVVIE